jgi:hypothetical protein
MSTPEQAMTSSRSRPKASRAWFVFVALLLLTGVANAGRKRVVVLEFEGDKAAQFHEDVVRLIKKTHTVVSVDKWNGAAEEMSATTPTGPNIKKVAKKLKVDGVVSGTVEKRRDEYILRMKLRSGASGDLVGSQINIKSESPKLDGTAAKDLKDELIEVIGTLEANRDGGGGGGEDEEEKPKKSGLGKKAAEDEEEKPKKAAKAEEEKPKKSGFGKKAAEAEEEKPKKAAKAEEEKPKKAAKAEEEKPKKAAKEDEEKPKKGAAGKKPSEEEMALKTKKDAKPEEEKPKKVAKADAEEEKPKKAEDKKPKKVAAKDDEEGEGEGGEVEGGTEVGPRDGAAMYSPGERFLDAALGMSFTARRMAFSYDTTKVTSRPAGYKQSVPVPGAFFDITAYPLAYGHQRKDILRHIGATVMFDRVIGLNSKNPNDGMKLSSTEQRFALGAAFRYPLGVGATAPVVGAALRYGQQTFSIAGMPVIPNVSYSMFDFTGFFRLPIGGKMVFGLNAALLLPMGAGDITLIANYGRAKITGFEGSAGLDDLLMKNIFVRLEGRLETLGYAFLGEGMKSTGVGGARDTYFGGALTAGFLY